MAMLLVKRKVFCFLFPSTAATAAAAAARKVTHPFYSSSKIQNPSPPPSFIVGYMMESFGFSLDKATKASKYLTHIQSPSNPDSVVRFFKQNGLSDTQIATVVSNRPRVLCSDVANTLQPKIAILKCLFKSNAKLVRAITVSPQLMNCSLEPAISRLRGYGISDDGIMKIVSNIRSFNPTLIDEAVKWAEELGFARQSGMFKDALYALHNIGRTRFGAKFEFLKSLGLSEAEVFSAIRKAPMLLAYSDKKIRTAMNFFTKEAELEPSFVAYRPVLVMLSLEKRVMPRFCVLRVLKREELIPKRHHTSAFFLTQKEFLEKYVHPHVGKVPGLLDGYLAACSGTFPVQWKS